MPVCTDVGAIGFGDIGNDGRVSDKLRKALLLCCKWQTAVSSIHDIRTNVTMISITAILGTEPHVQQCSL